MFLMTMTMMMMFSEKKKHKSAYPRYILWW